MGKSGHSADPGPSSSGHLGLPPGQKSPGATHTHTQASLSKERTALAWVQAGAPGGLKNQGLDDRALLELGKFWLSILHANTGGLLPFSI